MTTAAQTPVEAQAQPYVAELSRLFYLFRMAHLNRRYYSERLSLLRSWAKFFQVVIAASTAGSFALLSLTDFSNVKLIAAILSVLAFMVTTVAPALGLTRTVDDTSARSCAWHYAAQ